MSRGPKIYKLNADELLEQYMSVCNVFEVTFGEGAKLNLEQLCQILKKLDSSLSEEDVSSLWSQIDKDGSDDIALWELLHYIFDADGIWKECYEEIKGLVAASIYCRVRPIGADGHSMGEAVEKQMDGWTEKSITVLDRHERVEYTFPKQVLGPEATQEQVYGVIMSDVVNAWLMNSMNVMLLAYGQTGTGKTHTMFGPRESLTSSEVHPDWGLFPRAAHECITTLNKLCSMGELHSGAAWTLRASATEFYMMETFDLVHGRKPLQMDPDGLPLGADSVEITSVSDLAPFLDMVSANRTTSGTRMNAGSSRSHCALTLTMIGVWAKKNTPDKLLYEKTSLTLIDMAGSERPGKAGGERIGAYQIAQVLRETDNGRKMTREQRQGMEGGAINFELSLLRDEIARATEMNLTRTKYKNKPAFPLPFLKFCGNCFSGQCWMNAIICLSQSPQNGWETWFSANYGEALAKLQAPLKKVKLEEAAKAHKRLATAAAKAKKVLDSTPKTGAPSSKFWPLRQATAKHIADELKLLERLAPFLGATA